MDAAEIVDTAMRGGFEAMESDAAPPIMKSMSKAASAARTPKGKFQPTELRRDPKIDFPTSVVAGHQHDLEVRLDDLAAQAKSATAIRIKLARGAKEAQVDVTLHAPGFDVEALGETRMIVQTERDPALETVAFRLTARPVHGKREAEREISANFWLGNACIGAVSCRATVRPA